MYGVWGMGYGVWGMGYEVYAWVRMTAAFGCHSRSSDVSPVLACILLPFTP